MSNQSKTKKVKEIKPIKGYALVGRDRKIEIMDIFTSLKVAKEVMERSILITEIIPVLIYPIKKINKK